MSVKPSTIVWMVLWVIAAFGLYMVKYKVQAVRTEVAATERQLREEKKNLHVLTAEWTFLNRPERLQELSAKYLNVKPANGQQLGDIATLAYARPAVPPVSPQLSENTDAAFAPVNPVALVSGVNHVH